MATQEYLEQVLDILKQQVEQKKLFSDTEIENFKRIKPVSLGVQMIEVLNKRNRGEEFVDIYDFEKNIPMLPDYPHLAEVLEVIEGIYLEEDRKKDAQRVAFTRSFVINDLEQFCAGYDALEELCKEYIDGKKNLVKEIEKQLYILEDVVALMILSDGDQRYKKNFEEPNMGFLSEELLECSSKFILIENESNTQLINLIALVLAERGKEIFLLRMPLCYEADDINIKDTVAISVENIQKKGNIRYIHPIKVISQLNGEKDNISYLLEYINNHYNEGGHINVIGQGYQIDELSVRPFTNKKMTRLTQFFYEKREYNLVLARYGDYLAYISKIYQRDCRELLYKKATKKFSIVIPARDSIDTLQYTIKTCLEQTYTGDYEVVISDNSVKNKDVYQFCKELNDPRVNYVKTPRNLSLAKSFEFAYLHTNGEFVLSVGSDDGVLPWALEVIDAVLNKFPEEKIITWPRGFYAWPGFNYGQQHQFVIPNNSNAERFTLFYRESKSYLDSFLDNPRTMYAIPLLYINSGFKRVFMEELYQQTSELFDGNSQDLYTGIEVISLNESILNISLALTIAGMSSRSVGANSNKAKSIEIKSELRKDAFAQGNMGMNVHSLYEHLIPLLSSDVAGFYFSLMRAVSKGVLASEIIDTGIDWKNVFLQSVDSLRVENITYYEDLYKARYAASLHGEEFLEWFDKESLDKKRELCIINEEALLEARTKKLYENGVGENGAVTWDASEFGVTNIYDAVQLYAKLLYDERK